MGDPIKGCRLAVTKPEVASSNLTAAMCDDKKLHDAIVKYATSKCEVAVDTGNDDEVADCLVLASRRDGFVAILNPAAPPSPPPPPPPPPPPSLTGEQQRYQGLVDQSKTEPAAASDAFDLLISNKTPADQGVLHQRFVDLTRQSTVTPTDLTNLITAIRQAEDRQLSPLAMAVFSIVDKYNRREEADARTDLEALLKSAKIDSAKAIDFFFRKVQEIARGNGTPESLAGAIQQKVDEQAAPKDKPIVTIDTYSSPVYSETRADNNQGAFNFEGDLIVTPSFSVASDDWLISPALLLLFSVADSADVRSGGLYHADEIVTSKAGGLFVQLKSGLFFNRDKALLKGSGFDVGIDTRNWKLRNIDDMTTGGWWGIGSIGSPVGPMLNGKLKLNGSLKSSESGFFGELNAGIGAGYFTASFGDEMWDWNRWLGQAQGMVGYKTSNDVFSINAGAGYQTIFGGTADAKTPDASAVRLVSGFKIQPISPLVIAFDSYVRLGDQGALDLMLYGLAAMVTYKYHQNPDTKESQGIRVGVFHKHRTDTWTDKAVNGSGDVEYVDGKPVRPVGDISHDDVTSVTQFGVGGDLPKFWDPLNLSVNLLVGKADADSSGDSVSNGWRVETQLRATLKGW